MVFVLKRLLVCWEFIEEVMGKEIWIVKRNVFVDIFIRDFEEGDLEELRSSKDVGGRDDRVYWIFGCRD